MSEQAVNSLNGIAALTNNLNIYFIVLFSLIGIGAAKFSYLAMITQKGPTASVFSVVFVLFTLSFYKAITAFIVQISVYIARLLARGDFDPLAPITYFTPQNGRSSIVLSNYVDMLVSPLSFAYSVVTDPFQFVMWLISALTLIVSFIIIILWKIIMVVLYLLGPLAISVGLLPQWGKRFFDNWLRAFVSVSIWPIWLALILKLMKVLMDNVTLEGTKSNTIIGFDDLFVAAMSLIMIVATPVVCNYIVPSRLIGIALISRYDKFISQSIENMLNFQPAIVQGFSKNSSQDRFADDMKNTTSTKGTSAGSSSAGSSSQKGTSASTRKAAKASEVLS